MKPIKSINLNVPNGTTRLFAGRIRRMLLLFVAALLFTTQFAFAGAKETEASTKLKDALSKEFAGAADVKWYSEDNKTFMARFTMKALNVTAYFDEDGNLLATRRYIAEEHLPMNITNKLAKRYPTEKVRWVVEFETEGTTVYYVTLEGEKTWKVIKTSAGGDMSVHQHLKKV
ncbi:hypothetical protein [Chitinophaga rhizophila]|uniref:Beta-lactamase-inhibitor-like PepSY-like domain-containing protein n=1 Tax=Chitinophaga rhizophila TaxID=2866212 RepID=A0ABS7GDW1_9BACT|nr:hypothetical protein [Chitinophaga rhizophila]MBW8685855.1 hypothetical protein [Chitinophaga rhizophila]